MATIANLSIGLSADSAKLKKDLDKAGASTKKWSNKQKKNFDGVTKAVKGIGVALVALGGVTALRGMTELAKEMTKLSNLTGISTSELQRLEPALTHIGVSTEKYADIIKDVNDKMHDFLQTGGGPMKDFFEQIAPKVGLTADAFKELSGDEALQLYIDSLEKAGASQEQMTFYMEALASDSTMLLPLLKGNAEAMARFGLAADQVIDSSVLKDLHNLGTQFTSLMVIVRNAITNAFGPLISVLADSVEGWRMMVTEFPAVLTGLGAVAGAVAVLTAVMLANPILAMVAGFVALVTAAGWLYKKLSDLNEATGSWSATFELLGDAFGFEFTRMGAYATLLGTNIALVWNDIGDKFNIMIHGIRLAWAELVDGFANSSLGQSIGMEGGNVEAADEANRLRTKSSTDDFIELMGQQISARKTIGLANPFVEQITAILSPLETAVEDLATEVSVATPTLASGGGGAPKVNVPKANTTDASIGEGLLDSIQASFSTAMQDGDWKGFLESTMDSFTSTVIDNFAEGLFSPLDDFLGGAIDALMASLNGGDGGGGIWGSLSTIFGAFGAADGGIVPTTPFSKSYADSVPTMLQPGELVVPVDQVGNFMNGGSGGSGQTFNINVTGDVSRATRREIVAMMPQIANGTNALNKENGIR